MTKKPSNLTHKDKVTTKRIHDNYRDFETRKKEYEELKKMRQELKIKKEQFVGKAKLEREKFVKFKQLYEH